MIDLLQQQTFQDILQTANMYYEEKFSQKLKTFSEIIFDSGVTAYLDLKVRNDLKRSEELTL